MTRHDHLMVRAMEECNELAHRLSKALTFGMGEIQPNTHDNPNQKTNLVRIYDEYYDLRAVLGMAGIDAWIMTPESKAAEAAKVQKVRHYLEYSAKVGRLDP